MEASPGRTYGLKSSGRAVVAFVAGATLGVVSAVTLDGCCVGCALFVVLGSTSGCLGGGSRVTRSFPSVNGDGLLVSFCTVVSGAVFSAVVIVVAVDDACGSDGSSFSSMVAEAEVSLLSVVAVVGFVRVSDMA